MKDIREKDVIEIEFTEELLEAWTEMWRKKHTRAKKNPIKKSSHPSINEWMILRRPIMNSLKQNWASFTEFVVDYYGLRDLGISHCNCKYIVYKDSRRRSDADNITPKMILDGLSAEHGGVIVDDSSDCIEDLLLKIEYRKGVPGSKIIFYNCEYDKELLIKTKEKEQEKTRKREETNKENKKAKRTRKSGK